MKFIFYDANNLPPRPKYVDLLRGLLGGFCAILILELLSISSKNYFIMAPFGATCVILFAATQSPLAQPRNVIFGHFISALIGLIFLKFVGHSVLFIALAVGLAISLMQAFRCIHPPAGANPLVILLSAEQIDYAWEFLLFPVLSGTIVLVLIAYIINNIKNPAHWPTYWLALFKKPSKK